VTERCQWLIECQRKREEAYCSKILLVFIDLQTLAQLAEERSNMDHSNVIYAVNT